MATAQACPAKGRILIHATNIEGLGARRVVSAMIPALCHKLSDQDIDLWLPADVGFVGAQARLPWVTMRFYRRWLPRSLSRLVEVLFARLIFSQAERYLVLGDLPLFGLRHQTVFVHQPNLVARRVNPHVSGAIKHRVQRILFRLQSRHLDKVVVQTRNMQRQMLASYPALGGRIAIVKHPVPAAMKSSSKGSPPAGRRLVLFFPASPYPHKNHDIVLRMAGLLGSVAEFEVCLTLTPWCLGGRLRRIPWLRFVGNLSGSECMRQYQKVDALFFPSLLESYGLPLVEAMANNLPVICADLPYARELCGEEAIYFDPASEASAVAAIARLRVRLAKGWRPRWADMLATHPRSWDEVAAVVAERVLCGGTRQPASAS